MFLRGKKNHSATSISLQNAHCLIAMPDGRWPWALAGLDRCMYNARVCVLKKGTDISSNHHSLEYTFCPLFLGFVIHSKSRNNQFNHRMLQPASRRSDFPSFSWIPYFRMNQETSSTEWYSGKPTQRLPKSQQKKKERKEKKKPEILASLIRRLRSSFPNQQEHGQEEEVGKRGELKQEEEGEEETDLRKELGSPVSAPMSPLLELAVPTRRGALHGP